MMSFLDKVTKAVGDVVDKGKKDVDQFMKIQKINGEIGGIETKIAGFKAQIAQAKAEAGSKAIELLRAGTIASPELQAFLEQITGSERQIAEEEANIAAKKADIEKIKAEHEAEHVAAAATETPAVPPVAASPTPAAPVASARSCSACGASLAGAAAFCPQCGARQG
ncbi:MAG TPA: hypothetical protein VF332_04935 [Vicinamibacterales bacterium]|jgi:wobble nucleotide-excising tRNase